MAPFSRQQLRFSFSPSSKPPLFLLFVVVVFCFLRSLFLFIKILFESSNLELFLPDPLSLPLSRSFLDLNSKASLQTAVTTMVMPNKRTKLVFRVVRSSSCRIQVRGREDRITNIRVGNGNGADIAFRFSHTHSRQQHTIPCRQLNS